MSSCIVRHLAAALTAVLVTSIGVTPVLSQLSAPLEDGDRTRNVHVVGRMDSEMIGNVGTGEVEIVLGQHASRPFAYVVARDLVSVIDVSNESSPSVVAVTRIPSRVGSRVTDLDLAIIGDRHLLLAALESDQPGDVPAMVAFDVSDAGSISEDPVAEYLAPDSSSLSAIFAYRHSSGKPILFATGGGDMFALDLAALIADRDPLIARYPTPELIDTMYTGFRDVYAAFDPVLQQDRLYGAGAGGYYIYDVTDLSLPSVEARVSAAAVRLGTRIAATPDGRYLVTAAGYRTTPIYIFDMEPALEGQLPSVRTSIGAWTADWRNRSRAFEVRWPYVFVAALHDGFQMFNMRDPAEPYTVGYVRTWPGDLPGISERDRDEEGAWSIDVRNHDGLIGVTDRQSGLWLMRVDGFEGWHGHGWGVPNTSSVQDWQNGPDGAPQGIDR
ncbi:MAG: hypothetical protein KJO98_14945 [Rhodothermia bacterium]|nr:hypothetical protein [Rhodothermia bacterium]